MLATQTGFMATALGVIEAVTAGAALQAAGAIIRPKWALGI